LLHGRSKNQYNTLLSKSSTFEISISFFLFFLRRLSEVCRFIMLNGTYAAILININPVKQKVLKIKNYWSWTRKEKPIRRITGAIQRQASQSMHV